MKIQHLLTGVEVKRRSPLNCVGIRHPHISARGAHAQVHAQNTRKYQTLILIRSDGAHTTRDQTSQ